MGCGGSKNDISSNTTSSGNEVIPVTNTSTLSSSPPLSSSTYSPSLNTIVSPSRSSSKIVDENLSLPSNVRVNEHPVPAKEAKKEDLLVEQGTIIDDVNVSEEQQVPLVDENLSLPSNVRVNEHPVPTKEAKKEDLLVEQGTSIDVDVSEEQQISSKSPGMEDPEINSHQLIVIQKHWRGKLVRIRFQREMESQRLISEKVESVTKIQSLIRGYLARIKQQRRILSLQQRLRAVIMFQTLWRRFKACKIYATLQDSEKLKFRTLAAVRIQSCVRVLQARTVLKKLQLTHKERRNASALAIQQTYRSYRSRKRAAIKIQSCVRILQARTVLKKLQLAHKERRNASALAIQQAYRCYHSRTLLNLKRHLFQQKIRRVVLLQSLWRRCIARKIRLGMLLEKKIRNAVTCLQCFWRSTVSRQKLILLKAEFHSRTRAAVRIQSAVRVVISRRIVLELRRFRASTLIQNAFRSFQSRKMLRRLRIEELRKRVNAAVLTQRCWRGHRDRQLFRSLKEEKRRQDSATILQCSWRIYVSYKSLQLLRILDAQRKMAAATKIQTRIRILRSRKCLFSLRAAAILALQTSSAVTLQAQWRRYLQRTTLHLLREERILAEAILREAQRRELEYSKALLIQRVFRGWKCRLDVEYQRQVEWASPIVIRIMRRAPYVMRSYHPHVLVLTLRNATGINMNGRSTPNPYAIVGAFNDVSKMKSSGGFLGTLKTKTMLSYAKSRSISSTCSPIWREQDGGATLLISPASWNSRIVLTLMHSATFSKDSFLGQLSLDLRQFPQLYTGELVEVTDHPLTSYTYPIIDPETREDLALRNCPPGKGFISFTLRLPLLSRSMCGWVWRASTYSLTKGQFKRRWMVLIDYTLSFYKDPFTLNECKGMINCADVLDILDEEDDEGPVVEVYYGQQGKNVASHDQENCWILRWDRLSPPYTRIMWRQKLLKCCKHIRQEI